MTEEWKFTPGWPGLQSLTLALVSLTDQDRSFGQFHSHSVSLSHSFSLSHTHTYTLAVERMVKQLKTDFETG